MIVSMTGFGAAAGDQAGLACGVEVRSVNNRYLKTLVRLPDDFAALEPVIERLVREHIARGSVTVIITVKALDVSHAMPINQAVLDAHLRHLRQLAAACQADGVATTIDLAQLLMLPGVFQAPTTSDETTEKAGPWVVDLVRQALARHKTMREEEGKLLWDDLSTHLAVMRRMLASVAEQAPLVARQYHEKLRNRVQQMVADAKLSLADSDLLKEVALFADRADISEELARLSGHLAQFQTVSQQESQAGRKLDFIAQEMLREANTIASKGNDAHIARCTVEMKSAIDRVKEQVQNVE